MEDKNETNLSTWVLLKVIGNTTLSFYDKTDVAVHCNFSKSAQ